MIRWRDIESEVRSIPGWLLPGQDRWLFETAQCLTDGAQILEIGPFKGWSTAALAFGCVGTQKHVHSIDTFEGNATDFVRGRDFNGDMLVEFEANIARLELSQYVTTLVGKSSKFWNAWTVPLHLLFIDGSHQFADVKGDFLEFYKHVVPCGIVALHDMNDEYPFPGPRQVWRDWGLWMLEDHGRSHSTMGYGFKRCSQ